jgi:hypothetical protein
MTNRVRSKRWTAKVLPVGFLLMVLGGWAFFVPLVGPYFSFGFDTDSTWVFSGSHWTLSLFPGIAVFVGGLMMLRPTRLGGWTGGLLAATGGVWLVIGTSLHPVWSDSGFAPMTASARHTAALWIGCFYGVGVLVIYLAAYAQGVLARRVPALDTTPTPPSEPSSERAEQHRDPPPPRGGAVEPNDAG